MTFHSWPSFSLPFVFCLFWRCVWCRLLHVYSPLIIIYTLKMMLLRNKDRWILVFCVEMMNFTNQLTHSGTNYNTTTMKAASSGSWKCLHSPSFKKELTSQMEASHWPSWTNVSSWLLQDMAFNWLVQNQGFLLARLKQRLLSTCKNEGFRLAS